MAQIPPSRSGRKAARYGIPVAIAGAAAVTVGLVPALASAGSPDLPKITARQLLAKMAASDSHHMSGTLKVDTDLGLPSLPGASGGGGTSGGPGGPSAGGEQHGGSAGDEGKDAGSAAPQRKLMELASGRHTLRVAADGPERQRVSLVEDAAEYSYIRNGAEAWTYDSATDSAYHAALPKDARDRAHEKRDGRDGLGDGPGQVTPQQAAGRALKAVGDTTSVSVDGTRQVAGRDAYQLVIKPKKAAHSTVGAIRIAVDGKSGAPLAFTLAPKGGGKPVVDAAYTKVDFGKPSAGSFRFSAPKGTKVTERKPGARAGDRARHDRPGTAHGPTGLSGAHTVGKGWDAVAELKAPKDGAHGRPGAAGKTNGERKHPRARGMGPSRANELLDGVTQKVKGDFGTGRVFHTRLVNVLMTDDGAVYAGAVDKEALVRAADAAAE